MSRNQENLKKVRLCEHHLGFRGRPCRNGQDCFFAHRLRELHPPVESLEDRWDRVWVEGEVDLWFGRQQFMCPNSQRRLAAAFGWERRNFPVEELPNWAGGYAVEHGLATQADVPPNVPPDFNLPNMRARLATLKGKSAKGEGKKGKGKNLGKGQPLPAAQLAAAPAAMDESSSEEAVVFSGMHPIVEAVEVATAAAAPMPAFQAAAAAPAMPAPQPAGASTYNAAMPMVPPPHVPAPTVAAMPTQPAPQAPTQNHNINICVHTCICTVYVYVYVYVYV